jgi:hypothetical protein
MLQAGGDISDGGAASRRRHRYKVVREGGARQEENFFDWVFPFFPSGSVDPDLDTSQMYL